MYTDYLKTPAQAHQLKCPEYRVHMIDDGEVCTLINNRGQYYDISNYRTDDANCISSDCMAWQEDINDPEHRGFCAKLYKRT